MNCNKRGTLSVLRLRLSGKAVPLWKHSRWVLMDSRRAVILELRHIPTHDSTGFHWIPLEALIGTQCNTRLHPVARGSQNHNSHWSRINCPGLEHTAGFTAVVSRDLNIFHDTWKSQDLKPQVKGLSQVATETCCRWCGETILDFSALW